MKKLLFLCRIAYVCTYLGRLNYAACLVEIVFEEGWSKSQAGLIATGFSSPTDWVSWSTAGLATGFPAKS